MANELDQLRQSVPDLVRLDPLSAEVRDWLDRAHEAVKRVDKAEGVIFRMHQRYLMNPTEKTVAAAELTETLDRVARITAMWKLRSQILNAIERVQALMPEGREDEPTH